MYLKSKTKFKIILVKYPPEPLPPNKFRFKVTVLSLGSRSGWRSRLELRMRSGLVKNWIRVRGYVIHVYCLFVCWVVVFFVCFFFLGEGGMGVGLLSY